MINNFEDDEVLEFDAETSYMKLAEFQLRHSDYTSHKNILQEWNIYCIAWKWLNKKKVHAVSVKVGDITNDYEVCKKFREVLLKAKLVVGHNLDSFDIKKFNARLAIHGLPPITHKILTLDTKKAAKKHFAFSSNRLDYLASIFKIGRKMPHPPDDPWMKLLTKPDKKTLDHMVEYCKYDVFPLLEGVYLKLRPYIDHPFLRGKISGEQEIYCQHCNSGHLQSRGKYYQKSGITVNKYQCQERNCMGWTHIKFTQSKKKKKK